MNDLFSENLRKPVSNGKLSSPSVYFSAGRIYGQALSFEVSEKVPQLLGLEVTTRKYFIKGSTVLSGIN